MVTTTPDVPPRGWSRLSQPSGVCDSCGASERSTASLCLHFLICELGNPLTEANCRWLVQGDSFTYSFIPHSLVQHFLTACLAHVAGQGAWATTPVFKRSRASRGDRNGKEPKPAHVFGGPLTAWSSRAAAQDMMNSHCTSAV